jgi:hypothetical protein
MPLIKVFILGMLFASPAIAAGADALSLKLTALDTGVKAGGKIMARVTTTNESDHPIIFHNISRDCDYSFRVLTNSKTPAQETEYKKHLGCNRGGDQLEITGRNIIVTLKPGESSSEDILVTDLYDMSIAGTYNLQVDRTFPGVGHFLSNVVAVNVTP